MYKLAVFDVDGTLLDSNSQLSQENILAIEEAMAQGVKITLATGKHYISILPIIEALNLREPVVTCNGALTYCPVEKKVIHNLSIDLGLYQSIISELMPYNLPTVVYTPEGLFTASTKEEVAPILELGETSIKYIDDYSSLKDVAKILYVVHQGDEVLEKKVRSMASEEISVVRTHHYFLEFVTPAGNKSVAINQLALDYGIEHKEIIAFGDSENDVEMLKMAGLGVCMENGSEVAKASADVIVGNNDNHGVKEGLEKYVLRKA